MNDIAVIAAMSLVRVIDPYSAVIAFLAMVAIPRTVPFWLSVAGGAVVTTVGTVLIVAALSDLRWAWAHVAALVVASLIQCSLILFVLNLIRNR